LEIIGLVVIVLGFVDQHTPAVVDLNRIARNALAIVDTFDNEPLVDSVTVRSERIVYNDVFTWRYQTVVIYRYHDIRNIWAIAIFSRIADSIFTGIQARRVKAISFKRT